VVGLTNYQWHPIWPGTYLLDIYCHPAYWDQGTRLLDMLSLPTQQRVVAYADGDHADKQAVLIQAGFQPTATLPQWLAADNSNSRQVDVVVFVR
jgi:RimJ/RimL family protein N-acetyltransferase